MIGKGIKNMDRPATATSDAQVSNRSEDDGDQGEDEPEDQEVDIIDSLKELASLQPDTEYLDLSNQGICSIKQLEPHLYDFKNLRELNLEDNEITEVPRSFVIGAPQLEILNLNGNELGQFERAVDTIKEFKHLKSLFLNLVEESQVDYVMRTLSELEELNGLPVERDLVDESDGEGDGSEQEVDRFEDLGEIKEVGKETSSGLGGGSEDTPLKDNEGSPALPEQPSIDQTQMFMANQRTDKEESESPPVADRIDHQKDSKQDFGAKATPYDVAAGDVQEPAKTSAVPMSSSESVVSPVLRDSMPIAMDTTYDISLPST